MKIEELKIIAAVFQEPNLTKISRHYHISQSNLSKIIRRVEEELGISLFERRGFHGLRPTPQGLVFSERIQKFSRSWDDTVSLLKNYDQKRQDLKVTGPSLYMRNIFLPAWFGSDLPNHFRLTYIQSRVEQISLIAQSSDLDLVVTPSPFELEDWVPSPIFTERFALFCVGKRAPKSLQELNLKNKKWIAYRASNDILFNFLHQNQISSENIVAYIDDIESILDIIETQPHILSVLPTHAAKSHRQLKTYPIKANASQTLYLMHRSGNSALHEAVKDIKQIVSTKEIRSAT